jgi:ElaB/YqjD/DUF883 family membrane-anchored ribosome-binding protein
MTTPQPKLFPSATGATPASNDTSGAYDAHGSDHEFTGTLSELRASLDKLKADVTSVAERRASAIAKSVTKSADQLAVEIRKAPGTSIAIATLAGVLLAVVITSGRPAEPTWRRTARAYQDQARGELDALMARARHVADDARGTASGIMPSVERLVKNFSEMDVNSTLAPAIEKGSTMMRTAWQAMTGSR